MLLMGLDAEYTRARSWVQEKLTFNRHRYFSTFEVRCAFDSAVAGGARCGDGVRATYYGEVCPVGAGRQIRRSRGVGTLSVGVLVPTGLREELRTRVGGG
jgi:hypothetical protein